MSHSPERNGEERIVNEGRKETQRGREETRGEETDRETRDEIDEKLSKF